MLNRSLLYLVIVSILIFTGCLIKGRVVDQNGAGVASVTVSLSGDASMTTTTDSKGEYQFGTLANMLSAGSYTVTPSKSGNSITPSSKSVAISTITLGEAGDVPGPVDNVNFSALEDPSIGLTGTWNLYHTEIGGEEEGPQVWGINQTNISIIICESDRVINGSISGSNISIPIDSLQLEGTIKSDTLIEGTFSLGTWRMVKVSDTTNCSEDLAWDIDLNGIPNFVTSNHIELSKIYSISKFRSGVGHDYSDDFESCRSMKHYYLPFSHLDWAQIKIFSPVDGVILNVAAEGSANSGKQVHIRSTLYPAFTFRLFHVNLDESLSIGDAVSAGQQIGTHIGVVTNDDIALGVVTPSGWKLISFFDVMTNSLFQKYQARGAQSRSDFIISKAARDADPLNCTGETFGSSGTIENLFTLQ